MELHRDREPGLEPRQLIQRVETSVRALPDHQVPAIGNEAQLCTQPAGVLEGVLEGQLRIARPPDDHDGATDVLQIAAWIVDDESPAGGANVDVVGSPLEEAKGRARRERRGVRDEPGPEERAPVPRSRCIPVPERRHPPRRSYDAGGENRRPDNPRTRPDPGRRGEEQPPDEVGPALGEAEGNEAAEGVTGEEGRRGRLVLDQRANGVGERGDPGVRGQAPGSPVTGQVRREYAVALDSRGEELDPIRSSSAQPMHKHDRDSGTTDEIAESNIGEIRPTLLEARRRRCSCHARTVFSNHEGLEGAGPLIPARNDEPAVEAEPA